MVENRRWGPKIDQSVWKAGSKPPSEAATEQDVAAGSRRRREIQTTQGTILASIRIQQFPRGRRVYAYLQAKWRGRSMSAYVGQVTGADRAEMLRQAWRIAERKHKLRTLENKIRTVAKVKTKEKGSRKS